MDKHLDKLAQSHGIQLRYTSETGLHVEIPDEAKRSLLQVLGVDPETGPLGSLDDAPAEPTLSCELPEELSGQRVWGITCQLYGLRSSRNLGMGDFEDLARLAELAAQVGADFLGVSPLHAMFLADPAQLSPYSPSTRRFLNPLYLAIDQMDGGAEALARLRKEQPELFAPLDGELVDYPATSAVKRKVLRQLFEQSAGADSEEFDAFSDAHGETLRSFALFEAISAYEVAAGGRAGWKYWPGDFQRRAAEAVNRFEREHSEEVRFHQWLQFMADRQLALAQTRAKRAGMRIGLYLDFAVGVVPDGFETWADPELSVRDARVGAPPDAQNSEGQDWGLAPLAPQVLAARDFRPLAQAYTASMKYAGAIRIDHAMGLSRLWWIPASGRPAGGGYVRYPFGAMLDTVARTAAQSKTIVIGEDLGTVPPGFREATQSAGLLSYRVLYFEKSNWGDFFPPEFYPALALAAISTHDLATLTGWWTGADIRLRAETGRQNEADTRNALAERENDRKSLLRALQRAGLLGQAYEGMADGREPLPELLDEALSHAVHRFGARSPSVMFAAQLDDMLMSEKQPNLPGTTDEYPNWRMRLPVPLEDLGANPLFRSHAEALRHERPDTRG